MYNVFVVTVFGHLYLSLREWRCTFRNSAFTRVYSLSTLMRRQVNAGKRGQTHVQCVWSDIFWSCLFRSKHCGTPRSYAFVRFQRPCQDGKTWINPRKSMRNVFEVTFSYHFGFGPWNWRCTLPNSAFTRVYARLPVVAWALNTSTRG